MTLFTQAGDITIPNPTNQWELLLWNLIHIDQFKEGLTIGSYFQKWRTAKISSRLGEVEKEIGKVLVERRITPFTNRFSHSGHYVVYVPILSQSEYIKIYQDYVSK